MSSASFPRSSFPTTVQGARVSDVLVGAAIPLLDEEHVVEAISLSRLDLARSYTDLEIEAMQLIGSQVTLALANVELHARCRCRSPRPADGAGIAGTWRSRRRACSRPAPGYRSMSAGPSR